MQQRKRSLANGMTTNTLVRGASTMFFQQEKHAKPVTQRGIFWFCIIVFLGYVGGAIAIGYMYFQGLGTPTGTFAQAYDTAMISASSVNSSTGCPTAGCQRTSAPYALPTRPPTTRAPTKAPTTLAPTKAPTLPTLAPTNAPSLAPTLPTMAPTLAPTTLAPTLEPTNAPTLAPTLAPTTLAPTLAPVEEGA